MTPQGTIQLCKDMIEICRENGWQDSVARWEGRLAMAKEKATNEAVVDEPTNDEAASEMLPSQQQPYRVHAVATEYGENDEVHVDVICADMETARRVRDEIVQTWYAGFSLRTNEANGVARASWIVYGHRGARKARYIMDTF